MGSTIVFCILGLRIVSGMDRVNIHDTYWGEGENIDYYI